MASVRGSVCSKVRCGCVAVSDVAYAQGGVLREHRHERAYVSVLMDGAYTELRDGLPRFCPPGTAIRHAAGEVHADFFVAPGRCVNFDLDDESVSPEQVLRAVRATYPQLERTIAAALCEGAEPAATAPAWLQTVLTGFRWIEPVPLAEASELAGMHPAHFARAFRKHVGMTPGRYRRRERVRAVSRLLLDSAAPLSDIAQECGFADQSHLTNVFRETAGLSPKRYRGAFAR